MHARTAVCIIIVEVGAVINNHCGLLSVTKCANALCRLVARAGANALAKVTGGCAVKDSANLVAATAVVDVAHGAGAHTATVKLSQVGQAATDPG